MTVAVVVVVACTTWCIRAVQRQQQHRISVCTACTQDKGGRVSGAWVIRVGIGVNTKIAGFEKVGLDKGCST
jgi:hypothetical protein